MCSSRISHRGSLDSGSNPQKFTGEESDTCTDLTLPVVALFDAPGSVGGRLSAYNRLLQRGTFARPCFFRRLSLTLLSQMANPWLWIGTQTLPNKLGTGIPGQLVPLELMSFRAGESSSQSPT